MEISELILINSRIRDYGLQLHQIMSEMDSMIGLISALDSVHDQEIANQGKALPNDRERKLFKEHLQDLDSSYLEWKSTLAQLKLDKMMASYERESLKGELELHVLDIRRSTAKIESDSITKIIDNTNYVEELRQSRIFENIDTN